MIDSSWNQRRYRVADEDSYVVDLPSGFFELFNIFIEGCDESIYDYSSAMLAIKMGNKGIAVAGPLLRGAEQVEPVVEEIKTIVTVIQNWGILLGNNKRDSISGGEYWALVENLDNIYQRLSLMSDYTKNQTNFHGILYRNNIEELQKHFRDNFFNQKRDELMAPLYDELKKCRTQELSLPKYDF